MEKKIYCMTLTCQQDKNVWMFPPSKNSVDHLNWLTVKSNWCYFINQNHQLGLMSRLRPFLMCTCAYCITTYIISPKHRQDDQMMYDDNDECIKAVHSDQSDWSISALTDSNCSSIAMQWRSVTQNPTLPMRKNTNTPSEMNRGVLLLEDWGT